MAYLLSTRRLNVAFIIQLQSGHALDYSELILSPGAGSWWSTERIGPTGLKDINGLGKLPMSYFYSRL